MKKKTCLGERVSTNLVVEILLAKITPLLFRIQQKFFFSLTDFHKLVLTVLKTTITKSKPQKNTFRGYKIFDSVRFYEEIKYVLAIEKSKSCTGFDKKLLQILKKYGPL